MLLSTCLFVAVTFVVGRYLEDPKAIVQALDDQYAAFWNSKNYTGLASELYHEGALVIPPTATKFIEQIALANWLPNMEHYWNSVIKITAEVVTLETGSDSNTIHEIGSYEGVPNRYYQRWTDASGEWLIAFSALAIGGSQGGMRKISEQMAIKEDPFELLSKLDREFTDDFNNGYWTNVANLYNPGAQLIPPTCDAYILQPDLAAFFKAAHDSGINTLDLQPKVVVQENTALIHEIGSNRINGGSPEPYYVRWIYNGTAWQLAFDIMIIGN